MTLLVTSNGFALRPLSQFVTFSPSPEQQQKREPINQKIGTPEGPYDGCCTPGDFIKVMFNRLAIYKLAARERIEMTLTVEYPRMTHGMTPYFTASKPIKAQVLSQEMKDYFNEALICESSVNMPNDDCRKTFDFRASLLKFQAEKRKSTIAQ